jgi:hypothetical protein
MSNPKKRNNNNLREDLEKLLSIDFGNLSGFSNKPKKASNEKTEEGFVDYQKNLNPGENEIFDTITVSTHEDQPWVYSFSSKKGKNINTSDLEVFTNKLVDINGTDDSGKDSIEPSEIEDIQGKTEWAGRNWTNRESYPLSISETNKNILVLQVEFTG